MEFHDASFERRDQFIERDLSSPKTTCANPGATCNVVTCDPERSCPHRWFCSPLCSTAFYCDDRAPRFRSPTHYRASVSPCPCSRESVSAKAAGAVPGAEG